MGELRVGGLVSGLDTDGIVKQLLAFERRPTVLLEKKRDKLTTEANAWRDVNMRLNTLVTRLGEIAKLAPTAWNARAASPSDASVLTTTATSAAVPGTFTVEVISLAKSSITESGLTVADPTQQLNIAGTITVQGGPGNGKTFDLVATDSLNAIAATINNDSTNLGITASVLQVSAGDYRLVLTGRNGAANDFALSGAAADSLKISAAGGAIKANTAADAQLKVNGITVSAADNTVKDAIPGVTMTLLKAGATTAVTVTKATSAVVNAVKAFVDQYNAAVDFLGQQTTYDAKTKKAGPLLGEDLIAHLRTTMSQKLTDEVSTVPQAYNSLAMIGITSIDGGKLGFDQAKFTAAVEKDPTAVTSLLTLNDGTNKGVTIRAKEWLELFTQTGGRISLQSEMLDKQVTKMKAQIDDFDQRILPMREKRLRSQFAALERAMSNSQNQSSWLAGQLKQLG